MNGYKKDRIWSDRFIPQIKRIIGPYLLEPAPEILDMKEATDLIVLKARDMRIAARLRRPGYIERYPNHITMRYKRTNGVKTEFEKIRKGFADWFFYGHVSTSRSIVKWFLIDLENFRHHIYNAFSLEFIEYDIIPNTDGLTSFIWYDITTFPNDHHPILIAENEKTPLLVGNNATSRPRGLSLDRA